MSVTTTAVSSGLDGLLSLSTAAASAVPIPVRPEQEGALMSGSYSGRGSIGSTGPSSLTTGSKAHPPYKHRRLSSTGQARKRLSDAREAASRPSPVTISTAAATLTSLAKLSLSGTPPPQTSTTLVSAAGVIDNASVSSPPQDVKREEAELGAGITVSSGKGTSKKRGTIFKCESCSKVYRHPSCLIKHRWEHSPHWREASKFLLSKHQQVQMLEAAAILSHIAPSARGGTSLPEDRALWPSYLSGGLLPPPSAENIVDTHSSARSGMSSFALEQPAPFSVSSSVPAPSALSSAARSGPRMHAYAVPTAGGLTQLRPGVLAVPTVSQAAHARTDSAAVQSVERSAAVPINGPSQSVIHEHDSLGYSFVSRTSTSEAWSSPLSTGFTQSSFRSSSSASALGRSYEYPDGTGWSLPRSSIRSCSRSRSGSVSESDFVDVESMAGEVAYGFSARSIKRESSVRATSVGEKIEEEWDGMEMEMEMEMEM